MVKSSCLYLLHCIMNCSSLKTDDNLEVVKAIPCEKILIETGRHNAALLADYSIRVFCL